MTVRKILVTKCLMKTQFDGTLLEDNTFTDYHLCCFQPVYTYVLCLYCYVVDLIRRVSTSTLTTDEGKKLNNCFAIVILTGTGNMEGSQSKMVSNLSSLLLSSSSRRLLSSLRLCTSSSFISAVCSFNCYTQ